MAQPVYTLAALHIGRSTHWPLYTLAAAHWPLHIGRYTLAAAHWRLCRGRNRPVISEVEASKQDESGLPRRLKVKEPTSRETVERVESIQYHQRLTPELLQSPK